MRGRIISWLLLSAVLFGVVSARVKADDWPRLPDWMTLPDWPVRHKADPVSPNSLFQMALLLDHVEEKIRDDGVVTIKQPDVWSQEEHDEKYRKDFENEMSKQLDQFNLILPASDADRPGLVLLARPPWPLR